MSKTLRAARRATLVATALAVVAGLFTPMPANAAALTAPASLAPNDATTKQYKNLQLTWAPVADATSYEVQVDDDSGFADDVLAAGSTIAAYTVPVDLPRGGYAWRVRARNGTTTGPWSTVSSFTRGWDDRPTGLVASPAGDRLLPSLSWAPMADASFYEVEISDRPFDDYPSDTGRMNHWLCYTNHNTLTPYGVAAGREDPPGDESKCPFVFKSDAKPAANGTFPDSYFPGTFYWRVRGRDTTVDVRTTPVSPAAAICTGVWPETGGTGSAGSITVPLPYGPPAYPGTPECSRWSDGARLDFGDGTITHDLTPADVTGTAADQPAVITPQGCPTAPPAPANTTRDATYSWAMLLRTTTLSASWSLRDRTSEGMSTTQSFTARANRRFNEVTAITSGSYFIDVDCYAKYTDTYTSPETGAVVVRAPVDMGKVGTFRSPPYSFAAPVAPATVSTYQVYKVSVPDMRVDPVASGGDAAAMAVRVTDTPRFSWAQTLGAVKYRIYVSRTADFRDADHIWETMGLELQPVGDFLDRSLPTYWTVQACGPMRCGLVPTMKSYSKAWASVVQPISSAKSATMATLTWRTAHSTARPAGSVAASNPEVRNYELQIDAIGGDFSAPLKTVKTDRVGLAAGTSALKLDVLDVPSQFQWRVRGVTQTGYALPWSAAQSYDVTNPIASITTKAGFLLTSPMTITFTEPVSGVSTSTLKVVPVDSTTPMTGTLTQVSAVTWTFLPTTGYWTGGRSYKLAVSGIKDASNLPAVASTSTVRASTVVDNGSPSLVKVSGDYPWTTYGASDAFGGSYIVSKDLASTTTHSQVSAYVVGTRIAVFGCRGPNSGTAYIYVDGVYVKNLDLYRSYSGCGLVWSSATLTSKLHSIRIVTSGARNALSKNTEVAVDAVIVS